MNLARRINALEARQPDGLSLAAKAWLGQPLSDAEQMAFKERSTPDLSTIDTSSWSQELKTWLDVE